MSRWLENGDLKSIGKAICIVAIFFALLILFQCCYCLDYTPEERGKNYYGVSGNPPVIIANYANKRNCIFKMEVEEFASQQPWINYKIEYFPEERLHAKRISYAVIYYWEIK